jgi:hypothetical protein
MSVSTSATLLASQRHAERDQEHYAAEQQERPDAGGRADKRERNV